MPEAAMPPPPRSDAEQLLLAREHRGAWAAGSLAPPDVDPGEASISLGLPGRDVREGGQAGSSVGVSWEAGLAWLAAGVERVTAVGVATLGDEQVHRELRAVQEARRRLDARACRLAAAMTSRASARAREANGDDPRAGERAASQVRSALAEELRLSPSEVKRAQQVGDRVDGSAMIAAALDRGEITPDHVRCMHHTIDHLGGASRRRAEAELLEVARRGTPRDVTDQGLRVLAREDREAANDVVEARHRRRFARAARTGDGSLRLGAELHGLDAELFASAFHAWRRPDRPGERRTPDQRGADALVDLARASVAGRSDVVLPDGNPPAEAPSPAPTGGASAVRDAGRSAEAPVLPPTQHGVRPHVVVTVDLATVLAGHGVADGEWTGPLLWERVRHLLHDCGLTFLAVRDGLPVAVTEEVRTVPAGLWKALQRRDRGCIRTGCDMPAAWTQVAHLGEWFVDGGRLRLDNAGLLCTSHHRAFDAGRLAVSWHDGRPRVAPTLSDDPGDRGDRGERGGPGDRGERAPP